MSELSPELVLVLPPELRELALAALPPRAPYEFLTFRNVAPPAPPRRAPQPLAAVAYAAQSAFGMLVIGVGVMTAIAALVIVLQLAR